MDTSGSEESGQGMAIGLALGMSLGLCLGMALDRRKHSQK